MQFPVLIERVANNGFRASSGPPLSVSADGPTREDAIRKFQDQVQQRLHAGAEIATVEIPAQPAENPWVKYAGMFKDSADFQEVIEIMAENRRKMDEDPDVP